MVERDVVVILQGAEGPVFRGETLWKGGVEPIAERVGVPPFSREGLALDVRARQLTPFYEPILLFLFGQYFGAHTHTFCNS